MPDLYLLGFLLATAGFAVLAFVQQSWEYLAFIAPLDVVSVGNAVTNSHTEAGEPAGQALAAGFSASALMLRPRPAHDPERPHAIPPGHAGAEGGRPSIERGPPPDLRTEVDDSVAMADGVHDVIDGAQVESLSRAIPQ